MSRKLTLPPVDVLTASQDREGRLVLIDGKLVAVLVRLSDGAHDPLLRGAWYLECGFGLLSRITICLPAWTTRLPRSRAG